MARELKHVIRYTLSHKVARVKCVYKEEKLVFLEVHEQEDLSKGGVSSLIDKTQRRVRKDYEIYEI